MYSQHRVQQGQLHAQTVSPLELAPGAQNLESSATLAMNEAVWAGVGLGNIAEERTKVAATSSHSLVEYLIISGPLP